ncbi:hypothetical protein AGABI1DRAFT_108419 [Agaricus bisporus var. burnettii JB137-S8]|uniref:Sugar phosphate phosphatase n=1 Tax=Agaricus bisporus var. burnettii (strain JB137-S8 / ATCC MYA-4627 / FGSC 10392) TaxID=597362 RepID=K5XQH2_AGABU|nr:uncharacterized protein AGABI1DRAFT_108419 [Agaricus bisporus var. burnettii JB137-S8]EKM77045.1 hypothetical protein AGABI1DRAFT_108419 [Agaricus bisporus var. burnettii JB137-S8]
MASQLPYAPYDPTDKKGFSYETVLRRWPTILTGVIDELNQQCHGISLMIKEGSVPKEVGDVKIEEASSIMNKISMLKYEMTRDKPLNPIPNDGELLSDIYNAELKALSENGKDTWFTAPWLYAEYRVLRSYFVAFQQWRQFDPFLSQKDKTFKHSRTSVLHIKELAGTMHELGIALKPDDGQLEVVFRQMIQMSLWGNATDLSLLTHVSISDIQRLQAVGKEAQAAKHEFILKDDQDAAWNHLKSMVNGRVDFILDNSGFEASIPLLIVVLISHRLQLFTDLVFADFLVTYTPHVNSVVFHPKMIPWFVSDVTPLDFKRFFSLLKPEFFEKANFEDDADGWEQLSVMVKRWEAYVEQGVFKLSVPDESPLGENTQGKADFWTSPYPYWDMKNLAPPLYEHLRSSDLVIFKGDLNYRKLTGDIKWPPWTPFAESLRALAGSFPILSLRTNKADVVVGVDRAIAEELDAKMGNKWRVDGRQVEKFFSCPAMSLI